MRNVVIIHHEPLTKKIQRNFFIDELISKGVKVYFFDIHRILFGRIRLADEIMPDYNFSIQSMKQALELIKLHRDAFFIVEFNFTVKSIRILYYLKKYDCLVSTFGIHTSINLSLKEKILNFHNYGTNKIIPFTRGLFNSISVRIFKLFFSIKKIDIAFYCGASSLKMFMNVPIKIPVNSFDFEDFRDSKNQITANELPNKKYVVFLDQNLPFHPDIAIWGKQNINPDKYFRCLNNLFDKIEESLSLTVVIALHPKSEYQSSIFENRATYKYITAELVKNSEFVIAHYSLAISLAILNNKPIVFTYISDFYRIGTAMLVLIKKFSAMLDCSLLKIDDDYSFDTIPGYSKEGYLNYKYSFLTSKSCEDKLNADIIYNTIKSCDNV